MLEQLLTNVGDTIHQSPAVALVAVFVGGLLTASNPCVLVMVPLMMSLVAGQRGQGVGPARAFGYSLAFILGLSITFTLLGVIAALAGALYGDISPVWNWVVAAVCLVMGLHLMGILKFTIPVPFSVKPKTTGVVGALVMGLLFGVVSTPCAAPILVVLLTYLASGTSSVPYGALLLLAYALGHSVLILIAGTSMGLARKLIESKKVTRATDVLRRAAGVVIVGVGGYFIYVGVA
jgi:cytochrome c biogenesis protein CcdA